MSVGTVFGIDGTSVIFRAFGEGRMDYAKKACAQPVADLLSTALVVFLYVRTVKRMEAKSKK